MRAGRDDIFDITVIVHLPMVIEGANTGADFGPSHSLMALAMGLDHAILDVDRPAPFFRAAGSTIIDPIYQPS